VFARRLERVVNNYENSIRKKFDVFVNSMASLLSKFRINYESLKMVSGITETPKPETVNFFNSLIEGFSEENVVDPGKRNMGTDTISQHTVVIT